MGIFCSSSFVNFQDSESCQEAVRNVDGTKIGSFILQVFIGAVRKSLIIGQIFPLALERLVVRKIRQTRRNSTVESRGRCIAERVQSREQSPREQSVSTENNDQLERPRQSESLEIEFESSTTDRHSSALFDDHSTA